MGEHGFPRERTVFAGDSGNDLDVLASAIPSVLVANADPGVRAEARRRAVETVGGAIGTLGMIGGQVDDLEAERSLDSNELRVHEP